MPNLVANDKILAELLTVKVSYKMADTVVGSMLSGVFDMKPRENFNCLYLEEDLTI